MLKRILLSTTCLLLVIYGNNVNAQVVPGTGTLIEHVGDDFEDPDWSFVHNFPKGSRENNDRTNGPSGYSTNGRFIEGPERGQPDHMQIVPTPAGGLPGSRQALWVSTLHSGVPGQNTNTVEQDDLIAICPQLLGTNIRPSESPNCVVRVFFPEPERWEKRNGPHFGFRLGCRTTAPQEGEGFLGLGSPMGPEPYWPGIWVHYRHTADRTGPAGTAFLTVRGDANGRDIRAGDMDQFGWWTFGISATPDGQVHYYAKRGVGNLTAADRLSSQYPYGFRTEQVTSFFFNFCNLNDGKTWSTPIVIDDPQLYLVNPTRVLQTVEQKQKRQAQREEYLARRQKMMEERRANYNNRYRNRR